MRFSKALVAISLVVGALTVRSAAQTVTPVPFVAGDVLVKFKPGVECECQGRRAQSGWVPLRSSRSRVQASTVCAYRRAMNQPPSRGTGATRTSSTPNRTSSEAYPRPAPML